MIVAIIEITHQQIHCIHLPEQVSVDFYQKPHEILKVVERI